MLNFKGGKFIKKQIALATAAAMVLGLAACGSKPAETKPAETAAQTKTEAVTEAEKQETEPKATEGSAAAITFKLADNQADGTPNVSGHTKFAELVNEYTGEMFIRDSLNRAFKRVKANKGAPGIDGMTVEEAGAYLRKTQKELIGRIKRGKYTPDPVRRVEITKQDGGIRKLGIPTVKDRIFQQAITQQLMPVYEPLFSENSYGYRPGISAKAAILKVKEYAEQGYTHAVTLDLSKYFDTLNHEMLLNILRRNVKDERVIQWIKRYLKSGVMENGVVMRCV